MKQALKPHFPRLDLGAVRIRDGIPWYVRLFGAVDPAAYTSGFRIRFASGWYDPFSADGIALIAHELVHCTQYQDEGTWTFRRKYLMAFFRNRMIGMGPGRAYWEIPFEREARAMQAWVRESLRKSTPVPQEPYTIHPART